MCNCQATTLNVAINASNKALLTIMMSNNFVELKGSVFKKFDRSNLFQVFLFNFFYQLHLFHCTVFRCLALMCGSDFISLLFCLLSLCKL